MKNRLERSNIFDAYFQNLSKKGKRSHILFQKEVTLC